MFSRSDSGSCYWSDCYVPSYSDTHDVTSVTPGATVKMSIMSHIQYPNEPEARSEVTETEYGARPGYPIGVYTAHAYMLMCKHLLT